MQGGNHEELLNHHRRARCTALRCCLWDQQEDSALALERSTGSKRCSMRRARVWKNSGILNQQRHHRWLRSDEPGCWEVHQTVHRPQRQGKEEGYHCDFPMPGLRMVPDVQWKDSCRCLSWQTFQGKLPHSSGRSESKRGRLTFSLFRNAHSAIPELAFSFSGIYKSKRKTPT